MFSPTFKENKRCTKKEKQHLWLIFGIQHMPPPRTPDKRTIPSFGPLVALPPIPWGRKFTGLGLTPGLRPDGPGPCPGPRSDFEVDPCPGPVLTLENWFGFCSN